MLIRYRDHDFEVSTYDGSTHIRLGEYSTWIYNSDRWLPRYWGVSGYRRQLRGALDRLIDKKQFWEELIVDESTT